MARDESKCELRTANIRWWYWFLCFLVFIVSHFTTSNHFFITEMNEVTNWLTAVRSISFFSSCLPFFFYYYYDYILLKKNNVFDGCAFNGFFNFIIKYKMFKMTFEGKHVRLMDAQYNSIGCILSPHLKLYLLS